MVLFKTDAEKGEGLELAKTHAVKGYPTFVLANAQGEMLDRWSGYEKSYFTTMLGGAMADPTTEAQKKARFAKKPTAADAEKLARFHSTRGETQDAIALYRKAAELDPTPERRLDVLGELSEGLRAKTVRVSELIKERDAILATKPTDAKLLTNLTSTLRFAGSMAGTPELVMPALAPAIAATKGATDPQMQSEHTRLLIDNAILVEKDMTKAVTLKKSTLPEGWRKDAGQINGFAWWCFENKANLAEAESIAKEGVQLAPAGAEKAMILDTYAEILFANGKKAEAVAAISEAIKEDPAKEYYAKQKARFEGEMSGSK